MNTPMGINPIRELREPINIVIPCKSKLRKWAFENAYTLIIMAFFFGITWVVMIVYGIMHHGN